MPNAIAQRLQELGGLDDAAAARLVNAVIRVLTDQVPAWDRSAFLARLPSGVSRPRDPAGAPSDSPIVFYTRVSALAGVSVARAAEITQIVCTELVELLDADARAWLAARLPPALAAWLVPRESHSRPPIASHTSRRHTTLAEGQVGSAHPLSEARADCAHYDSIARTADPHGDTKLSSTSGPTQVREHETLAEANPRPARSMSTAKG